MNLNIFGPKNQTQDFLLSITENFETIFEQTRRKARETLEVRLTDSRKIFSFKPPCNLGLSCKWMIRLTG